MNKVDRLSDEKITKIFDNYEERKKKISVVTEYKEDCPNFKKQKCAGEVFLKSKSGCNFCLETQKYDLNNAMPPIGTKEYEKLKIEQEALLKTAIEKCDLSFDENYCRYKHTFNYCSLCKKEFRRKER